MSSAGLNVLNRSFYTRVGKNHLGKNKNTIKTSFNWDLHEYCIVSAEIKVCKSGAAGLVLPQSSLVESFSKLCHFETKC